MESWSEILLIVAMVNDFPRGCNFFEELARSNSFHTLIMPITYSTDICTSVVCFWSWLIVLWGDMSHWVSRWGPLSPPSSCCTGAAPPFVGLCLGISTSLSVPLMDGSDWSLGFGFGTMGSVTPSKSCQEEYSITSSIFFRKPVESRRLTRAENFGNPFSLLRRGQHWTISVSFPEMGVQQRRLPRFPAHRFGSYAAPGSLGFSAFRTGGRSFPHTHSVVWPNGTGQGLVCFRCDLQHTSTYWASAE